jgi:formylglycine-generating enzyme required for sulfatase activity
MKWYVGLFLGLSLVFGASVSRGEWQMMVHRDGRVIAPFNMADIDSVTFHDETGACCVPAGTCTVTTQANCGVTWTLNGICVPNPCPQPTGACCNTATGACTITTQAACQFSWLGADVPCNNVTCPMPPPVMVLIPAGTFTMGSPTSEPGRFPDETEHQVTLTHAIYVSTYEVTQWEWQAVMGWNESCFQGANRPVEIVTWFDALSYCNQRSTVQGYTPAYTITGAVYSGNHITSATVTWNQTANGYRLLTDAEWEYACRATSTTAFCNGGITNISCSPLDPNLDQVGWYCGNGSNTTHDVGGKTANAWGLKDMHGNVWEWCWDWVGTYPTGPVTDPTGPASGRFRVKRGGSWGEWARDCRSARRGIGYPAGDNALGLRLARSVP